jgi:hypothetical protein
MGGAGIFPVSPFFIKVDTVGVSIYNRGLEVMPMEMETWLCLCGLLGVFIGVCEALRGE